MPEFEARRTSAPPFFPPAGPSSDEPDDDDLDSADVAAIAAEVAAEPPPKREGLPPGYRMRHDSHYVDQLTTRAAQPHIRQILIRDIDGAHPPDARDLEPLVRSIAKNGIVQPLIVRSRNARYELIAGARRFTAAAAAGLAEVPCLVYACDDIRARALAEAENLRAPREPAPGAPAVARETAPASLQELRQSFGTIESCLHLLGHREASLRDRVALDLVRTEAHRASRLVKGLHALAQEPTLSVTDLSLRTTLDDVLDALTPERRLTGVQLALEVSDSAHTVSVDPDWISVGLTAAVGGMFALVQSAKTPAIQLRLSGASSGPSIMLELSQHVVTVPAWALARFFDPQWTDRPGGYQAAVDFAAARRVIEWHRGGIEVLAGDRGGCRLVVVLPAV